MDEQQDWNLISRVAIGDLLRRRARDSGPLEAIVDYGSGERRALSYAQFNARVNRLVGGLRGMGLKQGERIGLVCGNGIDFLTSQWACFKSGIVMVPINTAQSAADIAWTLDHAGVRAVIVEAPLWPLFEPVHQLLPPALPRIVAGVPPAPGLWTLEGLIDRGTEAEPDDVAIDDRDPAQIMYTSGTTSKPKGVVTSNLALVIAALANAVTLSYRRPYTQLAVLPQFHTAAQFANILTVLLAGRLVSLRGFDAAKVAELLERERVSSFGALPMMWKALLTVPGIEQRDFSSLQRCGYGMAAMDTATVERLEKLFGCPFDLPSGQTEFAPCPTMHLGETPMEVVGGNCWGTPTPFTDQAILDDEGHELPPGQVGEICWRGPQVMNGYYLNEAATAEVRRHGWHHSGDLGYIDACGQLQFVDRKKDMIKSGGENVASARVEEVLLGHRSVAIAAAIGLPHPRWGEAVVGIVQPKPGESIDEQALLAHCAPALGGFQRPKRIIVLPELPMTATGKIRKAELRQQFAGLFDSEVETT